MPITLACDAGHSGKESEQPNLKVMEDFERTFDSLTDLLQDLSFPTPVFAHSIMEPSTSAKWTFVRLRQRLAQGARWSQELMEEVAPWIANSELVTPL